MASEKDIFNLTDPEVLARLSRLSLKSIGLVEGSFSGMHKSPHRGSSVEFAQYRKYVPGDDVNNIDWRVYAKSDRFYIKEFEADTNMRCHLLLDSSASMKFQGNNNESKLHYAKKLAATLAHILIQQGDTVGLQCFSDNMIHDIPARGSAKHLGNILTLLRDIKGKGETKIVEILHDLAEKIKKRAMIIIFSDCFTDLEPLLDCFQHIKFRKHDLVVFHLLSEKEIKFDFDRSIRFVDFESSTSIVTEPALIRNDYLKELNLYLNRIKKGCSEFHVDYRQINIEQPYDQVLTDFLLQRQ